MLEWDEAKRRANLAKHRLDFRDAVALFDGRPRLEGPAAFRDEARHVTVGVLGEVHVTLVWTWRLDRRRLISFRRVRREERQAYSQAFVGGPDSDG
ncbi:BrnT family toxin [Methylobacterium sp.]|uniref:BrnT family toxin n=1 Tax=Methylobacterium sp. TaxID=409 RepID=UPI003AFF90C7